MVEAGSERPTWPEAAIFPPHLPSPGDSAIRPRPRWFAASDGRPLAVLEWQDELRRTPRAAIVVLHGVQSHAGWYHGLGHRLAAAGFVAIFPDRRGSGANAQARGHAASSGQLVEDVAAQLADLRTRYATDPVRPPVLLAGISWGGKLVIATAAQRPDLVDGIALICPGLTPRVGVTVGEKLGIALAVLTGRAARRTFPIPLSDPALFTGDSKAQAFIASDPLSLRQGTAGLLASSFFLDRRVRRAPGRVQQPALLMLAGQDRIVDNARTRATFERLASERKTIIDYPEAHHTLEFEPDPTRYVADLVRWVEAEFPRGAPAASAGIT